MHPPAMPPNFKKNGAFFHEIRVFEVSVQRYAKNCFVKVGTFCCVGSHMKVGKYGLAALIRIASSLFGVFQEND